jgi:hypothetical protein
MYCELPTAQSETAQTSHQQPGLKRHAECGSQPRPPHEIQPAASGNYADPSGAFCTAERTRSNIPQQTLVLLNDPTYVEAARVFAARILKECSGNIDERITWAWQQALQRTPTTDEIKTVTAAVRERLASYRADPQSAESLLKIGLAPMPAGVDKAELAAWAHVARILLNLHETITRS